VTRAVSEVAALAVLREAAIRLEAAGIETARQDAEWLLAGVLGIERFAPYLDPGRELSAGAVQRYRALVTRRAAHEPLQHLTGMEDFHGLRLVVGPDVLIPRPETEGLVEWALEVLRDEPASLVADVGTGSGAIACALAQGSPCLTVFAIDRSLAALRVASRNVERLGLGQRVKLMAGDLLEALGSARGRLDLVIANPPYIPSAVIGRLAPEVAGFEPRRALDGGPDGMAVIRRLIAAAPLLLRPRARLLMEIGLDQAGPVASRMAAEGCTGIEARRDLRGVERYIGGQWAEASAGPPRRAC
jgi:release factor glutamine methyltransferase